jgi:hypothetical protein
MSYITFSTAIKTLLASALVVSAIGAVTPGGAGAAIETPTQTSTTSIAPARQESIIPTTTTAPVRALTINAETEEQAELVAWALRRFEEAELELPPLTINTHSDRADCDGKNGYLAHAAGGEFVIHSCGNEFTLLHELAHAWDKNSLDDETRAEFLKLAQATTWDNNENWYLAGGEHAANVIAWGLVEDRINQTRTRPYDHNSMVKGFEILTGGEPLWMNV